MTFNIQNLIQRAQKRDVDAVTEIYNHYVERVYRYVVYRVPTTHDAEDLTSDIFVSVLGSISSYENTGVPFEAWLFQIASRRIADHYRYHERRPQSDLTSQLETSEPQPEEQVQEQEEFSILRDALFQLSDEQQSVLVLRFIEGKTHDEVAQIIGKGVSAVRSIQHRALIQLTRLLGTEDKVRHYLRGE